MQTNDHLLLELISATLVHHHICSFSPTSLPAISPRRHLVLDTQRFLGIPVMGGFLRTLCLHFLCPLCLEFPSCHLGPIKNHLSFKTYLKHYYLWEVFSYSLSGLPVSVCSNRIASIVFHSHFLSIKF